MLFSDLLFVYAFLASCLFFYFIGKSIEWKNGVLIVFSLIFYAWGEPIYVFLMLIEVAVTFLLVKLMNARQSRSKSGAAAVCGAAILFCLLILGVFKYTGFFMGIIGAGDYAPVIKLPIGISFYTFQIISYILDVYWGKAQPQRSFAKYLAYIALFPQLVAGPIVRYTDIAKSLESRRSTAEDISAGLTRFCIGLGKKVIIANNLSVIVDSFLGNDTLSLTTGGSVYGIVCYALQIYFDFSGYSDMAIGLGRVFGFRFNENFNYPYASKSITEFWQRWHISLGSFFRDYLLPIPIFGVRNIYLSLFVVWFATGLWHGASWNFVLWGLYYGAFILIERMIGKKRMKKIPSVIGHTGTLAIVLFGYALFYYSDMNRLGLYLKGLFGGNGLGVGDLITVTSLQNNLILILAAMILCLPVYPFLKRKLSRLSPLGQVFTACANLILLFTSSILLVNSTNNPFLYFNF